MSDLAWAEALVRKLFETVDRQDADAFVALLAPQARFSFGNADAVIGQQAIRDSVADFFSSIDTLSHSVERVWGVPEALACHGQVEYRRIDGGRVTLPFAVVLGLKAELVDDYRVYIDIAPLYT